MPMEGSEVRPNLLSRLHPESKLLHQHVKGAAETFTECLLHSHSPYPEFYGLCNSNFLSGQSHLEASIPGVPEGSQAGHFGSCLCS